VNKETNHLFEKYQTPEDYAEADLDELAEDLNSITYFNSKAEYLKNSSQKIVEEHDGDIPDTMSALTDLPGVGRKTANVVLQHGHDITEGVVVDTHVQRLSQRLGIVEISNRDKIEDELMDLVAPKHWQNFTHWLIAHGRDTCTARNPDCSDCLLENICPSSKLQHDVDLADGSEW
jgi:endonuclease-3